MMADGSLVVIDDVKPVVVVPLALVAAPSREMHRVC